MPKAVPADIQEVVANWRQIVSGMPGMIRTFLQRANLSLGGDNTLLIVLDDSIGGEMLSSEERRQEIANNISQAVGKEIKVQVQINDTGHTFEEAYVDLNEVIHMDIEYEEEEEQPVL